MEKLFMRHTSTLIISAFCLCVLILSSCQKETAGSILDLNRKKPNIILILGDDIGYEIPNYTGGQSYSTPSINALAASGVQFSRCHVCPNCSPSRVELLTGKYGFRNYAGWGSLDPSQKTFANMLHNAGYKTCVAGKWQLGGGDASIHGFGFDKYRVFEPFDVADETEINMRRYKNPSLYENGDYLPDSYTNGKYADDLFTDYIFNFIDSNLSSPFFVYFSLSLCHKPFSPTPDDAAFATWDPLVNKSDASFYPSMVKYMDKKVKQVVDKINAVHLTNKTIIIFLGDNGTPQEISSEYNDQTVEGGKNTSTIYGTHVPLILSWPGTIPAKQVSGGLIDGTDFLPTLADAAGIKRPTNYGTLDGISFYPLWFGETKRLRDWIYCYWQPENKENASFRVWTQDENYKLYDSTYNRYFFNISTDPLELNRIPGRDLTDAERARKRTFDSVLKVMH